MLCEGLLFQNKRLHAYTVTKPNIVSSQIMYKLFVLFLSITVQYGPHGWLQTFLENPQAVNQYYGYVSPSSNPPSTSTSSQHQHKQNRNSNRRNTGSGWFKGLGVLGKSKFNSDNKKNAIQRHKNKTKWTYKISKQKWPKVALNFMQIWHT